MARITKIVERFIGDNNKKYSYAQLGPIFASQIKIDKTNDTLLEYMSTNNNNQSQNIQAIYKYIDNKISNLQKTLEKKIDDTSINNISEGQLAELKEKISDFTIRNYLFDADGIAVEDIDGIITHE